MIVGDPFDFAISWEIVESWNTKASVWENGIFRMYIGDVQLPPKLEVAELKVCIGTYAGMNFSAFENSLTSQATLNRRLDLVRNYIQQKNTKEELALFSEGQILNLTCTVMEDQNCWAFLLKKSDKEESIIWTLDDGDEIHEHTLPLKTVENVIRNLEAEWNKGLNQQRLM